MGYEVRRMRVDDWPEYRRLRLEALKDSPLAFVEQYDESVAQPDEFWQRRVERNALSDQHAGFVAVTPDGFVGKAGCFVESEFTDRVSVHIVGVYVTPQWRGSGRGVATALLGAAIGWAREHVHADRIRLYVLDGNGRAAAFYRRLGFVATGGTMAYPPDPSYTELEMEYRN
jgi:ribosomal protein S18 acetylase RimI-like enzyme